MVMSWEFIMRSRSARRPHLSRFDCGDLFWLGGVRYRHIPSIKMTRPVWVTSLGSEFDNFLFAPIGDEGNGMLLSVISALARLDLDPWQEATKLARLPGETATKRLASLIAALPDGPSAHRDPGSIAARLILLLPREASSSVISSKMLLGAGDATKLRAGIFKFVVFMVIMLVAQWIAASRQPSVQVDNAYAPASSTVSPQNPPQNLGR